MLDIVTLNDIMDKLSKLNTLAHTKTERALLLEIGYYIKQEMNSFGNPNTSTLSTMDPTKLLEDNKQLFNENQSLIRTIQKMENIVNDKIPSIQNAMDNFNKELKRIIKEL